MNSIIGIVSCIFFTLAINDEIVHSIDHMHWEHTLTSLYDLFCSGTCVLTDCMLSCFNIYTTACISYPTSHHYMLYPMYDKIP